MYKGTFSPGSLSASTNIPLTMVKNTNYKTEQSNNAVMLKTRGLWNVKGNLILTATADGDVTLNLVADGNVISSATVTAITGNKYTLNINDVVTTDYGLTTNYVALALQTTTGVTIVGGDFIIESEV